MKYIPKEGFQPVPNNALVDLLFADGVEAIGVEAGLYSWTSVQVDRIVYWRMHEEAS